MTIIEAASTVGSISGAASLGWIIFQWGRGSSGATTKTEDPYTATIAGTMQALADTQKQLTDQVYQIAQVVRDLTTSLRTTEQLAAMRHEVVSRELAAVRQSLDAINHHQQR